MQSTADPRIIWIEIRGEADSRVSVQSTKPCRCEFSHRIVTMALNRNVGKKKAGSGRVVPAHCIVCRHFRAAALRALYFVRTVCKRSTNDATAPFVFPSRLTRPAKQTRKSNTAH
ncbi:hypothetical protein EVAR_52107_1 [Eumeta japonica]|uniref:Uncharacterized protein n=1 Tax=Eumeta variegata TaxID=151549 RepID=A0A4C1XQJ9_EUMVA|nr:hypothetical protein EVAR_52107_1 [Eumeta japonica]